MALLLDLSMLDLLFSNISSRSCTDISPLVQKCDDPKLAELEDVKEVVRLLDSACQDVGFFYAKGHGVATSLCEDVLRLTHEFFICSEDEKLKIKLSKETGYRGYQNLGVNVTNGRLDMHEAIDCYKEFEHGTYGELGHTMNGPNLWPDNPPKFKAVMQQYVDVMLDLSMKILRGIALALGGPPGAFEKSKANDPFWVMRIIRYPPLLSATQSANLDDTEISCGAHTDYGLLTLVNQDAEPCALQVKNEAGEWIWAPPIPGTFVVNIGDMLKIFSSGRYQPTLHRVINNNSIYRVSVPFFLEPNFDAAVEPFEFCEGKLPDDSKACRDTKPVIYGEHLVSKVTTNFFSE